MVIIEKNSFWYLEKTMVYHISAEFSFDTLQHPKPSIALSLTLNRTVHVCAYNHCKSLLHDNVNRGGGVQRLFNSLPPLHHVCVKLLLVLQRHSVHRRQFSNKTHLCILVMNSHFQMNDTITCEISYFCKLQFSWIFTLTK